MIRDRSSVVVGRLTGGMSCVAGEGPPRSASSRRPARLLHTGSDRRSRMIAAWAWLRSSARLALAALLLVVACAAGCDRDPETRYGTVRGESLNGVSAFVQLLRDTGLRTGTRRFLSERIVGRADVAIVFAAGFGPPDEETRALLGRFLAAPGDQTLVFVARDSDAAIDYWQTVAAMPGLEPDKAGQARARQREAAVELRANVKETFTVADAAAEDDTAAEPSFGLAARPEPVAPPIDVEAKTAAGPVRVTARWPLARVLEPPPGARPLWSHDGEPLLVESRGRLAHDAYTSRSRVGGADGDRTLVLASAAPLLNGGLVDPGNRRLAAALVGLLPPESRVVVVGSARVRPAEEEETGPSTWRLLAIQPHPWIAAQALLAVVLFCWWKAPIFGRPRREATGRPQNFGHHVDALGGLLEKSRDEAFAHERLEAWRRPGE